MDYPVPTPRDLADVRSLNLALLVTLRCDDGRALCQQLPETSQALLQDLTVRQAERLASAPFLLLSLQERDSDYWQRLLDDDPRRDLFAVSDRPVEQHGRIIAAAIGFAWQLSRRNAYAARLVCGASLDWCQRLAAQPLVDVLSRAGDRSDLLALREVENETFWRRLLGPGLSADASIRNAAHVAAMQMIQTGVDAGRRRQLRSAACRAAVPTFRN